jgi:peptidoglycan/LPS O-acetylase OafA/YrhL
VAASILRPGAVGTRSYVIRRAARLLPLYYLSILVAVAFIDPGPLLSGSGRIDLLAHVTMVHGLFRDHRYSINGVWWTLTVEWLFYLLLAVLAPFMRKDRGAWLVAAGLVVVGITWRATVLAATDSRDDLVYLVQQLPGMADLFGVGILLAAVQRAGWLERLAAATIARWALFAASGGLVVASLALYDQRKSAYWESRFMVVAWPTVLAIGLIGLFAVMATRWSPAEAVARRSGLALLGRSSYGIYLFHPFVISALFTAWAKESTPVPVTAFAVVTLCITAVVSIVAHHAVERPSMLWARVRTREG